MTLITACESSPSRLPVAAVFRYLEGNAVQLDLETAAFFLACASDVSHIEYHRVGKQPIIEMQRLTAANEAIVEIGQKGENDDAIQYQIHRAEQGDVPSIEALGDLYYWGARGIPRDQNRALRYFTSAGDAGSNNARCAAAVSFYSSHPRFPSNTNQFGDLSCVDDIHVCYKWNRVAPVDAQPDINCHPRRPFDNRCSFGS